MLDKIRNEPVLITGLVQAALALVVAFGLDVSQEQIGAILAVTAAVLALVARARVTPVENGGLH
jgi:hypothetical protein